MNVKKLMDKYIKDNPGSSMIKYYKNINKLMGRYIVNRVDKITMRRLLLMLDYYKYETGYAIANDKLLLHADYYRNKKMNLRIHYHITSSTLFNVLEGRRVSIEFAVEFCKLNNLKVNEYFNIYSVKKSYSISNKENIKGRIKYLFDYAVENNIITETPVPKKYRFYMEERVSIKYIPTYALKEFVETVFKSKNANGKAMTIIYMLVGLDRDLTYSLRIKDLDFRTHTIKANKNYFRMSEYISEYLEDYFQNEDPNNKLVQTENRTYLKTLIYKYKDACNHKNITIETLQYNYKNLLEILNAYHGDDILNKNVQIKCNESKINYNDFKQFLKLKKAYEEGLN